MKCQILFSGKNKKNISKCHLLKILPRVLSVNMTLSYVKLFDLVALEVLWMKGISSDSLKMVKY